MGALLLLSLAAAFREEGAPNPSVVLRALANGYEANRQSVDRGKATFLLLDGHASSPEAARRGEIEDVARAKGTYVFDGPRKRYERLFDREDEISHAKVLNEHESVTPFISVQALTDGTVTLLNMPLYNVSRKAFNRQAMIHPGTGDFNKFFGFPLMLGAKDFHGSTFTQHFENAQGRARGYKSTRLEEGVSLEGLKVDKVTFEYDEGEVTFWIDHERGCVPIKCTARNHPGAETHTDYYEHLSFIDGKLWMPLRTVHYIHGGKKGHAKIFQIENLEIDAHLSDRDFELSFREPTSVIDVVNKQAYEKQMSFSLSKHGRPVANISRPIVFVDSAPPPMPQLPGEIEPSHSWISYVCWGISILLAAFVVYRILRRQRGAHGVGL